MTQTLTLCDEYGIIHEAMKILPDDDLKIQFLEALAELRITNVIGLENSPKLDCTKSKG